STIISFYLPTTSRVQINIYNLLAQKLVTLVSKEMPAGIHQVRWDAGIFSSGIYIYQISTSYGLETGKLILMQ
ncbi:MAG: T9SS type A sorting domain-containing protein, partial [Candidatus Hodarchaeales archaeon]